MKEAGKLHVVEKNADFAITKGVQDVIQLFFLAKKSIPYSCASSNKERSIKKKQKHSIGIKVNCSFYLAISSLTSRICQGPSLRTADMFPVITTAEKTGCSCRPSRPMRTHN